jgi:hypothetical protein
MYPAAVRWPLASHSRLTGWPDGTGSGRTIWTSSGPWPASLCEQGITSHRLNTKTRDMHGMILRLLDQQVTNSAGQHHRRQCNTSDLENR